MPYRILFFRMFGPVLAVAGAGAPPSHPTPPTAGSLPSSSTPARDRAREAPRGSAGAPVLLLSGAGDPATPSCPPQVPFRPPTLRKGTGQGEGQEALQALLRSGEGADQGPQHGYWWHQALQLHPLRLCVPLHRLHLPQHPCFHRNIPNPPEIIVSLLSCSLFAGVVIYGPPA